MDEVIGQMSELKELVAFCPCGDRATYAVVIGYQSDNDMHLPVCVAHSKISGVGVKSLPTHTPYTAKLVGTFPPKQGELFHAFGSALAIGCPKCGLVCGLDDEVFKLDGDDLSPSFVCPQDGCGLHVWVRVEYNGNG